MNVNAKFVSLALGSFIVDCNDLRNCIVEWIFDIKPSKRLEYLSFGIIPFDDKTDHISVWNYDFPFGKDENTNYGLWIEYDEYDYPNNEIYLESSEINTSDGSKKLLDVFDDNFGSKDINSITMTVNTMNRTIDYKLNDKMINAYKDVKCLDMKYQLAICARGDSQVKISQFDIKKCHP